MIDSLEVTATDMSVHSAPGGPSFGAEVDRPGGPAQDACPEGVARHLGIISFHDQNPEKLKRTETQGNLSHRSGSDRQISSRGGTERLPKSLPVVQ